MSGPTSPQELDAAARQALLTRARSPAGLFLQSFQRQGLALVAFLLLVGMVLLSALAPWIANWRGLDPEAVNLLAISQGPSDIHWLGTDELGRDLFLRLLYGGRVSLSVGLAAALCSAVLGSLIGLVAGYFGGRLDAVLMRLADSVIALPLLPLLIVLAALDLQKLGLSGEFANAQEVSFYRIVGLISLVGWTTVARLVRAATLSLKAREFVRAAEAMGVRDLRIMFRHILPNALSPLIVAMTLSIGNVILLESVLSFLGLGIQPPLPSWGNMLTGAQESIWSQPRLALWPGLMIFLTVIAFNLLGDGLQSALNPRRTKL